MHAQRKRKRPGYWHRIQGTIRSRQIPVHHPFYLPFWLRIVAVSMVGLILLVALLKPRIWRSTPPGTEPVIRVSGLGLLQSWSLKRTALKTMAAGKPDAAAPVWRMAVSHDPGNIPLVRGYLEALAHPAAHLASADLVDAHTRWLLMLTHTNQASLELVVRVFDKYRRNDLILDLLDPRADRLSPALAGPFLKALFHTGRIEKFGQQWAKRAATAAQEPELQLYHAAYQAGWGPAATVAQALHQLEAKQDDPQWRELANRLQLSVSVSAKDTTRYQQSLRRLWEWKLDTPMDHIALWKLLAVQGRVGEAVPLAQSYANLPATANEALRLAEAYAALGLRDKARQLLQEVLPQFNANEGLWQACARLLSADGHWKSLAALALQMRQERPNQQSLLGYSYFLEGYSAWAQQKRSQAEYLFRKLPEFKFDNLPIFAEVAGGLLKSGFADLAKELIDKTPPALTNNIAFWQSVFIAANDARRTDLLFQAAESGYRLRPSDWSMRNNYAAALITLRRNPEEAVGLTFALLAEKPDSTGAKINHGLALVQNKRATDAAALFRTLDGVSLTPAERSAIQMGWFEIYLNQRDFERARQADVLIDRQHLFPVEQQWLDQALLLRIPKPATNSS